jgi:hypothetical protein
MISATNTCSDDYLEPLRKDEPFIKNMFHKSPHENERISIKKTETKKSSPPFYGKTECVLYQNVFHFDTKRIPFPYKTPPVLIQNATTASQE